MRLTRRVACLPVLAGAALLAAIVTFGPDAVAAGPVTLTGAAPAVAHSPGTVGFSYTLEVPDPLGSAVFTTQQPAELPARTTGVTLDGVPVPASQPDPGDLAVPLGTTLSAGRHTVAFTADIDSPSAAIAKATARLDWSNGSLTSAPVTVRLNQPDLSVVLTPGSGEGRPGLLGAGRDLDLQVDVANLGYGTPRSTLAIALPAGLALGPSGVAAHTGGAQLDCDQDGRLVTCRLGVLLRDDNGANPTLDIDLASTRTAPAGRTVPVVVSVQPEPGEGTDTDPADNSVTALVRCTGSVRLSYRLTPARTRIPLGGSGTVTLTVHNSGPQPAPQTIGINLLVGGTFEIAGFTGKGSPQPVSDPPPPGGDPNKSGLLWQIGELPAGGSISAVLTVRAVRLGTGQVSLIAFSGATDLNCLDPSCPPAAVALRAVPVPLPVKKPVPKPVGTPAGTSQTLPNTGQAPAVALTLGLGSLLAGCALLLLGRRQFGGQ